MTTLALPPRPYMAALCGKVVGCMATRSAEFMTEALLAEMLREPLRKVEAAVRSLARTDPELFVHRGRKFRLRMRSRSTLLCNTL